MAANKRKKLTKECRRLLHQKFNYRCAYCGCNLAYNEMTADHIHPLEKHGLDVIENIVPACYECNNFKDHFTLEQFRRNILLLQNTAPYDEITNRIFEKYNLKNNPHTLTFYFEQST